MPFSVWKLENLALEGSSHSGDQSGYDEAVAAVLAAGGGMVQVGPGHEALNLGTFPINKLVLVRVTKTGQLHIGGLHVMDDQDPLKCAHMDMFALTSGIERTYSWPDWSGIVAVPLDFGTAGQFLRSAGAGAQPAWAAVTLEAALAAVRGSIMVGDSTPLWSRLPIGAANTLLKSDGLDPSWGAIALLSAFHSDTLADAVQAGDILIGNATPKWARLPKGADGQVLQLVAGLPAWGGVPAASHDTLAHIRATRATGCGIVNGTNRLTTTGGQFANVRVGDRVNFDITTPSTWGARVTGLVDSNNVDLDLTNTGSTQSGRTCVFTPGDHWDPALTEANGYALACGRGTYDAASTPGGSIQKMLGSWDFEGYESGHAPLIGIIGSTSVATPYGFNIKKPGTSIRAYFMVNNLTASRVLTVPDRTDEIVLLGGVQTLQSKTLSVGNKLVQDGTATYSVFQSAALVDRLSFDLTPMSALRGVKWGDHAGTVRVQALVTPTYGANIVTTVNGGTIFKIVVTNGTAFQINNPTLDANDTLAGKEIAYDILNSSGGAMGAVTWDTQFKMDGSYANPANGKRRTIRFYLDGTNWVQLGPCSGDI